MSLLLENSDVLGKSRRFIDDSALEKALHRDVLVDVISLKKRSESAGFNLCVVSGYRSFEQQLAIWNAKVSGSRVVLDQNEQPIDAWETLSEEEQMFSILRWSALPGASRHHWGTDFDVYDPSALPEGYQLQLVQTEYAPSGVLGHFGDWLSCELKDDAPFFRPYAHDDGGVAPEPWHLSHKALSKVYAEHLSIQMLEATIREADIALKSCILDNLTEIYERFIRVSV